MLLTAGQARLRTPPGSERTRPLPTSTDAAGGGGGLCGVLHQLLGNVSQELTGRVVLDLSPLAARLCPAEVEALLGTGEPHIGQPALFGELLGVCHGALVRKDAVLHPGEEDHRKLQSLGGVQRHQRNLTLDRKSTRLNSSHVAISYAVFRLKKK